jgi:hypothetical protein
MRAAAVVLVVMLLTGCGTTAAGSSDGGGAAGPSPRQTAPVPATPSARPLPAVSFQPSLARQSETGGADPSVSMQLSPGPAALVADYDQGAIDATRFTRVALSLLGYLGDPIPERYAGADLTIEDTLALTTAADRAGATLPTDEQAAITQAVQDYTHRSS